MNGFAASVLVVVVERIFIFYWKISPIHCRVVLFDDAENKKNMLMSAHFSPSVVLDLRPVEWWWIRDTEEAGW